MSTLDFTSLINSFVTQLLNLVSSLLSRIFQQLAAYFANGFLPLA